MICSIWAGLFEEYGSELVLKSSFETTQQNNEDSSFQLFVGVFGVVGNTSGIIWFSRKLIQKNFHQLMLSLALCDLLYVLLNILLFGVPSIFKHITTTSYYNHMVGSTKTITGPLYFKPVFCHHNCIF